MSLGEPEPGITYETLNETNILDIHRHVPELNISFRGQDIQEQNLNLRIFTINVANSGEVNILADHYDRREEWGIRFIGGQVIETTMVESNSPYLLSNLTPERLNTDTVAFPKVIFDKDAFFVIEVLVVHQRDQLITISPVGKIAGIKEISVETRALTKENGGRESLWRISLTTTVSIMTIIVAVLLVFTVMRR